MNREQIGFRALRWWKLQHLKTLKDIYISTEASLSDAVVNNYRKIHFTGGHTKNIWTKLGVLHFQSINTKRICIPWSFYFNCDVLLGRQHRCQVLSINQDINITFDGLCGSLPKGGRGRVIWARQKHKINRTSM